MRGGGGGEGEGCWEEEGERGGVCVRVCGVEGGRGVSPVTSEVSPDPAVPPSNGDLLQTLVAQNSL